MVIVHHHSTWPARIGGLDIQHIRWHVNMEFYKTNTNSMRDRNWGEYVRYQLDPRLLDPVEVRS